MAKYDFAIAVGGAPGQGIETAGKSISQIFARYGLNVFTYTAYQSLIRGGHSFLTIRISSEPIANHGDKLDLIIALDRGSLEKHLPHVSPGGALIYNSDDVKQAPERDDIQLCPISYKELTNDPDRNKRMLNVCASSVALQLVGVDLSMLEDIIIRAFLKRKGQAVVDANVAAARASYNYAAEHFTPFDVQFEKQEPPLAFGSGNTLMAMGGASAGVKFYAAYPMSPSTGVLHWMAPNARDLGIIVRQCEDEISVINMVIGAAHTGARAMCATSGGGFALMSEAIGSAGMMEIPIVVVNVQRGGPSTGLPTKTEQGDLWQVLGASQGDFPKIVVSPTSIMDGFNTIPELFNLVDKFQCPGMVLTDLSLAEGHTTFVPDSINWQPEIDRGELITDQGQTDGEYLRYQITDSGISPRAIPGTPGHMHVVATDDHDEDGGLISDEFTNPHKRRDIMEKRQRKMEGIVELLPPPTFEGPEDAEVTLIGWGSTHGVISEAAGMLTEAGIAANHIHFKWLYPMDEDAINEVLAKSAYSIIVECNYTGQFARFLRGETGFKADSHIRKYDGEPFMPHHVVDGARELLNSKTDLYVPYQEIVV
ncbi:2-oxoacid:acceptor oxidoreductase subunit alpha [Candidatus Poribacteria bacterium]|nr:2-oxoacid:acceptor oxidoreductase subunit alpha [Candidatus Poribacteria bacterium]MYG07763.1 2-oxoacid:acceptor oxidoreductase subunit alpha [Candidatus Poribacteria bacterium]MYK23320.1 2-oxoacid:acceptor oxidoreductase subunit alpha [Candidatus Poribacteria bacterium]